MAEQQNNIQDPYYSSQKNKAIQIDNSYSLPTVELIVYTESRKIKVLKMKFSQQNEDFTIIPKERFVILDVLDNALSSDAYDRFLKPIEKYYKKTKSASYDLIQLEDYREVSKTIVFNV